LRQVLRMAEPTPTADPWQMILFVFLLAAALLMCLGGMWLAIQRQEFEVLALGLLAVITVCGIWSVAGRGAGGAANSSAAGDRQLRLLQTIAERLLVSDQAKRIAYREKDREALRQAIIDDIRKEDYAAAMVLVNDMAEVYGYREEAEQFRQQVVESQARKQQTAITTAVANVESQLEGRDWEAARQEIDRLMRMYPDQPEIRRLPLRLKEARERHKHDLIRDFKEAFEREDNDRAAELLTAMDRYLSPEEARPYMDMAREVLNRKRENMGVQFKMALQDRDWIRAVSVGEQIIREFPNTLFAAEVREMLDTLRDRAAGQRAAVG
jgi:outer membrane protein assembly factor BamD (BamD/ComL family)